MDGGWSGIREEKEERLLAFCTSTVTLGVAETDRDMVLSMYISCLLRLKIFF